MFWRLPKWILVRACEFRGCHHWTFFFIFSGIPLGCFIKVILTLRFETIHLEKPEAPGGKTLDYAMGGVGGGQTHALLLNGSSSAVGGQAGVYGRRKKNIPPSFRV